MNSLKATCTSYLIGSKVNRRTRGQLTLENDAVCNSEEKVMYKCKGRGKRQLLISRVRGHYNMVTPSYFNGSVISLRTASLL